jgi:pimeloyl-ACP methyl ester carboxylesterase
MRGMKAGALMLTLLTMSGCATAGSWQRAKLGDVEIEYELAGAGDPIVFVHAGVFADWFGPFSREPALRANHRVLNYHRAGYAGSSSAPPPHSIAQQSAQLQALLNHLELKRVNLVGHSSGGAIAIQLALDAPGLVKSLVLLEPAIPMPGAANPGIAAAMQLHARADTAGAIDTFMRAVAGPDYRGPLDARLPGAFAQGVADADTFFRQELPAVRAWIFTREDAKKLTMPVLAVLGERSDAVSPTWRRRHDLLLESVPHIESFTLPGATHLMHLEAPDALARRMSAFYARDAQR